MAIDRVLIEENSVQERAAEFTRFYRFATEWARREALGQVRALGADDYRRVLRLYHKADYPNNVGAFIAANAVPPA